VITNNRLDVFENFRRDEDLPKFKRMDMEELTDEEGAGVIYRSKQTINLTSWTSGVSVTMVENRPVIMWAKSALSVWRRFIRWVTRKKPAPVMTIPEFFMSVTKSADNIELVAHRANGYERALLNAKMCGQKALVETLSRNLVAVRGETQLVALGLRRYLTEEKLVEFVKKCPKGLRLDWIANFTRVVPADLMRRKTLCDEHSIFDNYVVLHYDPHKKSWAETEAEKAARRDPILFGLIDGRRQLYYLGDWVDEFCNLTIDQIADQIGSSGISELQVGL